MSDAGNCTDGKVADSVATFDAAIVGGGIVGAAQALLLARKGWSVLLIEVAEVSPATEPLQQRSVALSHRSVELLEAEGLWVGEAGCSIREIHVSDRGHFGSARLTARDLNADALGYVVANHTLEQHLRSKVLAEPNIEFLQPATATLIQNSDNGVELQVATEIAGELPVRSVRCTVLIAADGTHSGIRQSLGVQLKQHHYEQVALVANVACQFDHQHIAYERFTDSGPLALLPLAPRCMAMVFTARDSEEAELRDMPDAEFLQLLQRRFGGKLGRFSALGARAVFPLSLSESELQTVGSCVLIGNSARTLHPVAGQGLNLALRDVFALTRALGGAAARSGDEANQPSMAAVLADFQQSRRPDQRSTVRRTDLLARVFSDGGVPLSGLLPAPLRGSLRGAGLLLLDGLAPLRKRFAADSAGVGVPLGRSDN